MEEALKREENVWKGDLVVDLVVVSSCLSQTQKYYFKSSDVSQFD